MSADIDEDDQRVDMMQEYNRKKCPLSFTIRNKLELVIKQ